MQIINYRFSGDKYRAQELRGIGLRELQNLRTQMSFAGLKQYSTTRVFPDGQIVKCSSVFGVDTIEMYAPPAQPEQAIPLDSQSAYPILYTVQAIDGQQPIYIFDKHLSVIGTLGYYHPAYPVLTTYGVLNRIQVAYSGNIEIVRIGLGTIYVDGLLVYDNPAAVSSYLGGNYYITLQQNILRINGLRRNVNTVVLNDGDIHMENQIPSYIMYELIDNIVVGTKYVQGWLSVPEYTCPNYVHDTVALWSSALKYYKYALCNFGIAKCPIPAPIFTPGNCSIPLVWVSMPTVTSRLVDKNPKYNGIESVYPTWWPVILETRATIDDPLLWQVYDRIYYNGTDITDILLQQMDSTRIMRIGCLPSSLAEGSLGTSTAITVIYN